MAIIENAKYNSLPEQVEENKDNIKKLEEAFEQIDPDAITAVIDQVATNTSDISNIKGEQITQNSAIGLNTASITSEINNRKALIDVSASGDTNVKAQAGKDINLYSSNKIQVYGDEGADLDDDYGDAVTVLKDNVILETTSHNLILNEDGTLKMDSNKIAENGHLTFENIYDKDGNPRFVEGVVNDYEVTGVTKTYGKWSLSGTHLMVVIAFNIAANTTLANATSLGSMIFPDYIYDKLVNIFENSFVDVKSIYSKNGNFLFALRKLSGNAVIVRTNENMAFTLADSIRIQFDLLIDNE